MPSWIGAFARPGRTGNGDGIGFKTGVLWRQSEAHYRLRTARGDELLSRESVDEEKLEGRGPWFVALESTGAGVANTGCRFLCRYVKPIEAAAEFCGMQDRFEALRSRWRIMRAIRRFFDDLGFMEVDTPVLVWSPGTEPLLDYVRASHGWLRSSPELHLKRLLAAGFDRIFELGPCFRDEPASRLHRRQFTMLEWYRSFSDLSHLQKDVEELLSLLSTFSPQPEFFQGGLRRTSVKQAFLDHANLDLNSVVNLQEMRDALRSRGVNFDPGDDWDALFFRLFLRDVEPHLGMDGPEVLTDYPWTQAALCKCAEVPPRGLRTCSRFELYLRGVEVANAFYELTDEAEHQRRWKQWVEQRAELGKPPIPKDRAFFRAVKGGLPPCSGIALGVDRLVMVLTGHRDLSSVLPFPDGTP